MLQKNQKNKYKKKIYIYKTLGITKSRQQVGTNETKEQKAKNQHNKNTAYLISIKIGKQTNFNVSKFYTIYCFPSSSFFPSFFFSFFFFFSLMLIKPLTIATTTTIIMLMMMTTTTTMSSCRCWPMITPNGIYQSSIISSSTATSSLTAPTHSTYSTYHRGIQYVLKFKKFIFN